MPEEADDMNKSDPPHLTYTAIYGFDSLQPSSGPGLPQGDSSLSSSKEFGQVT